MTQIERINTDKISGDQPDQLNQRSIPEHWSWVKLGDISAKITKGSTPTSYKFQYQSSGVKFIRTENIDSEGKVFGITKFINDEANNFLKRSQLKEKDILFSIAGTIGRVGVVSKNDIPANTNQALAIIRLINSNVLHPFIYYYLTSPIVQSIAQKRIAGVGRANISLIDVSAFQIPLPPLAEQKKIVEKIEELFSGLDNGVASLKKAKEQIKLYRQSVLVSAFSGKLTTKFTKNTENLSELSVLSGLPHGWKWVKLGEVTNNFDGQRIPLSKEVRAKRKGEYRYFGATEIIDYIDDYIFDGTYLLIGEDGANLLSKSRPLSFIVDGKFWVNNHAHVLQTKNGLKIKYLNYFFNSISLGSYVTGSAQPKLTQKNLNKIPLPLSPLNQQTQIVEEIEKRFSEADNLEKAIDDSLEKSAALRQSILKQAFEGRLV